MILIFLNVIQPIIIINISAIKQNLFTFDKHSKPVPYLTINIKFSNNMYYLLNQGWSLIDFDDTKTLLICLLIMLFSVSEMYLIPKANQGKNFT